MTTATAEKKTNHDTEEELVPYAEVDNAGETPLPGPANAEANNGAGAFRDEGGGTGTNNIRSPAAANQREEIGTAVL